MATTPSTKKNRERMKSTSISSPTAVGTTPDSLPAYSTEESAHDTPPRSGIASVALLTSGLLWLCYFPVAWGWLAWIAFLPWLSLVRSTGRPIKLYFVAWLTGLLFYVPILQWMRVADPRMVYTWLGLALYCSFYFPLALYLLRLFEKRTSFPLMLTFPVVWTALEYFRSTFATGFSWYLVGHSQHDFVSLIQFSDITGAWGVSFLVMLGNAVVFELCWNGKFFRRLQGQASEPARYSLRTVLGVGVVICCLVAGLLSYGSWRLGQETMTPGPRIALIQGNVPQQIRNQSTDKSDPDSPSAAMDVIRHYYRLADLSACYRPDLIIWPETSYPYDWYDVASEEHLAIASSFWQNVHKNSLEDASRIRENWETAVLLGLNTRIYDGENQRGLKYNTALLIDERGHIGGMYHKIHRVPFGEYVPLRETFPWMEDLAPYSYDYSISSGKEHTRLPLRTSDDKLYHFGVVICYEDTDPLVTRPYGGSDGKAPADFLVNTSNDGWFDGTSEHEEHLAICRFRAIENRRSVARSVNMGISAVIDSNGQVLRPQRVPHPIELGLLGVYPLGGSLSAVPWMHLQTVGSYAMEDSPRGIPTVWMIPPEGAEPLPVSEWHNYKKKYGVFLATVPIDHRESLYARFGDWLPWLCWLFVGCVLGFLFVRSILQRRKTIPEPCVTPSS